MSNLESWLNLHYIHTLITLQATAGTKYLLTVEVAETICRKGVPGVTRAQCPAERGEENEICFFVVLHQPWLPSSHLLSAKYDHCLVDIIMIFNNFFIRVYRSKLGKLPDRMIQIFITFLFDVENERI